MSYSFWSVRIEFLDGEVERHRLTSDTSGHDSAVLSKEGCLHIYSKDGDCAPRTHVGSWPLANIRSWRVDKQ